MIYTLYRLFFGATSPIDVVTIRMIEDNLNLQTLIGAMAALDNAMSGELGFGTTISESDEYGLKLGALFTYIVSGKKEMKWNDYVYDTFRCFVENKVKMMIMIEDIARSIQDEKFLNLICYRLDIDNKDIMSEKNMTNLIKPHIFEVFENVQEIRIHSAQYTFSLLAFLSLLINTNINTVVILGFGWISDLWTLHSQEIVETFAAKNFSIEFTKRHNDCLIIYRL